MRTLNEVALSDRTTFVETAQVLRKVFSNLMEADDLMEASEADAMKEVKALIGKSVDILTDQFSDITTNEAEHSEAREELYSYLDDKTPLLKTVGVLDDCDEDDSSDDDGDDGPQRLIMDEAEEAEEDDEEDDDEETQPRSKKRKTGDRKNDEKQ